MSQLQAKPRPLNDLPPTAELVAHLDVSIDIDRAAESAEQTGNFNVFLKQKTVYTLYSEL
jgi:hypothetical protein